MSKHIYLAFLLFVLVTVGNSLKCYTYTCGSHGGLNCSPLEKPLNITCGIPLIGYQVVCSYVAIDDQVDGGYKVETACDLVTLGSLKDVSLPRCVDKDLKGKVVHCKICNTDFCNTPPI